ncbi:MAG: ABC transporter permease subunit [Candidatus Promineifilaceae bacterium]|jgi:phosphonate ABC transporter permease subunit PhnE
MKEEPGESKNRKRLRNIVIGIAIFLLFAYAVSVTRVNLEEPLEPKRQENLVGLLRELAHPDIFQYETESQSINLSIRMPCPQEVKGSQIESNGRVLLMTPNCASTTQEPITLTGTGYPPNAQGVVAWHPAGATTIRRLSNFRANDDGQFSVTFTMPDIRETEDPQRIEVAEILDRRITGPSDTTIETLQRMLETVLMALMASTLGTILAVPISFLGARNLMENVGSPLAAVMAAIIALPFGAAAGWFIGSGVSYLAESLSSSIILGLGGFVAAVLLLVLAWMLGGRIMGGRSSEIPAWLGWVRVILAASLGFLALAILAQLGLVFGAWLEDILGFFSFVGNFIYVISDFAHVFLPLLIALLGGGMAAAYGSRIGQEFVLNMPEGPARMLTAVLTVIGTALAVFAILYAVNWICLLGICRKLSQETPALYLTLAVPALIVGAIAGLLSLRVPPKRQVATGMATYSVTRTILNVLRAIEPVIMGFVLVIWVGIGPFAGVLALMLHSIADLGKLFSEQVENIDEGPVEAIEATGADKVQMINFAVVPQIVPHYLAFIFYRWDINVRMSTIIGFVGGGGIGLVLFRSTNLTQYRQASVMVIAIAAVVTLLDFVSSKARERII